MGLALLEAWGYLRALVATGSAQAVNLVQGFPEDTHPFLEDLIECKRLHRRIWSCSILDIPRCCNMCADCIAKLGYSTMDPSGDDKFWAEAPSRAVNIVCTEACL